MPSLPLIAALPSHFAEFRVVLLPLIAGTAAIWLLLPRPKGRQVVLGAVLGIVALVTAGVLANVGGASVETVLFYIFSGLAIVAGALLVTQANPARAALSFTLVVLNVCGLFVLLAAPFLMAATIIIYAGAIVVTFLFVLMLAMQTGSSDADQRSREPLLASLTGFVLLGALLYVVFLGFRSGASDLDPFLDRLSAAAAKESAEEMDAALTRDPQDLDRAIERLRQDNANPKKPEELAAILKGADFATRLRWALAMLGQTDLKNRLEDEAPRFAWPPPATPGAAATMRRSLDNYRMIVLAARQRVGLSRPDPALASVMSGFSGPPSAVSANLRRDEFGRPQAPAENATYLGRSLFTDYLLPVELGGFLLLVAVVGAIAIASRQPSTGREA